MYSRERQRGILLVWDVIRGRRGGSRMEGSNNTFYFIESLIRSEMKLDRNEVPLRYFVTKIRITRRIGR